MRFRLLLLLPALVLVHIGLAQQQVRKFPPTINHPTMDVVSPFQSLDGSTLLYYTYYGLEQEVLVYITQRARGGWEKPVELPKQIHSKLNMVKGYTLSPDGSILYITSIRGNGVGRYDIWYSERQGNNWGSPKNMFIPVNSKSHDATPTFTPDSKTMFFMRCDQMTQEKASGCKIFMTTQDNVGKWREPAELPANINTGNSQVPRILADGETLIFSSDQIQPNKGGMDLYYSKLVDGEWQDPKPIDFANTEYDDQYVSVMASGRYLTMSQRGERRYEIVDVLLPEEIRPKGVMKVAGTVLDGSGQPTSSYISVTDESGKRYYSGRPDSKDGSYFFYIKEGSTYELAVDHELGNYTYFVKRYDLNDVEFVPTLDKVDVILKELKPNDEFELDALSFKEPTTELVEDPARFRRLTRLLKAADVNFEIQVMLVGYEEDSVQSSPDLTEMVIDSAVYQIEKVDSLGEVTTYDSITVNTTFHNNRTEQLAHAILDKLIAAGIEEKRLTYFFNARPKTEDEERKLMIRIAARAKK